MIILLINKRVTISRKEKKRIKFIINNLKTDLNELNEYKIIINELEDR